MTKRSSKKGAKSITHPGDKDYTTKKGDRFFHRGGKLVKKRGRKPFTKGAMHGGRIRSGPSAPPPGLYHGGMACGEYRPARKCMC